MDVTAWAEIGKYLGVAAPFIMYLIWKDRENTRERQVITEKFLQALQAPIVESSLMSSKMAEAMREQTVALQELSEAIREHERTASAEHLQISDALRAVERAMGKG